MIKYFSSFTYGDLILWFFTITMLILLISYWLYTIYIINKKIKYIKSIGFKRAIMDLYELENYEEFYYIRGNDRITERRINTISYKELKKRYK